MKTLLRYLLMIACLQLSILLVNAQNSAWKKIKPSNTGIPGSIVRLAKFDPSGNLWVAARWPFWGEGGISKFDGVKWTAYSNVDSWMPSDIVNSVAFGQNGITWIGTDSGLIRFDGTNAQLFNMNNAPFPSNNIFSIEIDGAGNIWFISKSVSTIAHAVIKYDGTNWTIYNSSNSGIPYFDITTLGIDQNNNVWVGTWALGIARFNGSTWTVYNNSNSGFNGGEVSGFAFAANGDVWVTSSGSGIYKFSNNVWQNVPALPGNHSYSTVEIHPNGTLWFGTYGGLLVESDGNSFTSYPYGNHLYTIDFDNSGNVWTGGLAYVKKYVNGQNTLTYNVYNTALTSFFVDAIDFQPNGVAWFATSMGGVCRLDAGVWSGFNPYNYGSQPWTFVNNSAEDIFVDKQNGKVWVGSNGVGYWDGTSWNIFTLANSNIPDNDVQIINKDLSGKIWIGTGGYGAAYFDGGAWTRLDFGTYLSNYINDIAIAPDGSIWFATNLGLHKTVDGINFTTYYTSNSQLPSDYINTIAFEANGTMWVGTSDGLVKVFNNTWVIYTESDSGLPADFVSDIEISQPGTIWVSAFNAQTWPYYGGIAKFDGTTWNTYTPANSPLSHMQVEKLKLDPSGALWISTYSEGLVKFIQPNSGPLPVDLFSFTAVKTGEKAVLNWKTASEHNTDLFIVERSGGTGYIPIGTVDASGTSQSIRTYAFTDNGPLPGMNYYRLRINDLDGGYDYSNIVKLDFTKQDREFFVYPNPGTTAIRIHFNDQGIKCEVRIFDISGKLIRRQQSRNEDLIDVSGFKAGVYIVELYNGEKVYTQRFNKVN
jgi:ligand-binding sensor domain-containing protein